MRICLVSDYLAGYHEKWSGAEMVCKVLSQLLIKEGEEVFFFTTKFPAKKTEEKIYQIPALENRSSFFKKLTVPLYLFLGTFSAILYFKKTKPDIVNFLHSNYLFIPVMLAAKILKIPTVFTFLDYYLICDRGAFLLPDGKICDQLEGEICRRCIPRIKLLERRLIIWLKKYLNGVITFTETSKQRLARAGFPQEKIRVIYTYALPEEFKNKTKEKIKNSAFIVASFHEHKGLHVVLQAWQKVSVRVPGAKLTVVGSGPKEDKDRIDKLVNSLKISNSVEFLGNKENEEVLNLILEKELAIVPEQWPSEFGPLALVEALALGSPVVSSRIGSAPDFVKDGHNGFLVEPNNPNQFAEKIIWLLESKEEERRIGERAKETGKFLFNCDQAHKTIKFYQELIK